MSEELKKDIIDGKVIDWDKLSVEELKAMKEKFEDEERKIRKQIDEELSRD